MSDDAKAILLLCGRLSKEPDCKPLQQHQYNQLARWLKHNKLRPADLLDDGTVPRAAQGAGISEQRLAELLKRGVQLGFAVETWNRSGIWVNCRSDPDYPARYKQHLKEKAPPILFGAGNRSLLQGGGVAIVGSRNVDAQGKDFTREVAAWCARGRITVVSGGARGVDQTAMQSALDAGGRVIGVLAENLLRKSVTRDARRAIADDRLLLISPYHPEARFRAGTAMGRNKLIYAMAACGLVVSAEYRKGGTWAGAEEELKRRPARPIFVKASGDVPVGNTRLLDLGAVAFPAKWRERAPARVLNENLPSKPQSPESDDLPLFSIQSAKAPS
ncbi:MAG: DNA-processing protein DprA [Acidobacteriota bacterium]